MSSSPVKIPSVGWCSRAKTHLARLSASSATRGGISLKICATLALVLATVGIYGVVTYAVARRTHEIGVRMALGAQGTDVLKMVIRQGMVMTVGVLGAVAATRLLSSWLYEIEATDPATLTAAAVVLIMQSGAPPAGWRADCGARTE